MGYPGSTTQYLYSAEVRSMLETSLPLKIGPENHPPGYHGQIHEAERRGADPVCQQIPGSKQCLEKVAGHHSRTHPERCGGAKLEEEEKFRAWVEADGERQLKYDQDSSKI